MGWTWLCWGRVTLSVKDRVAEYALGNCTSAPLTEGPVRSRTVVLAASRQADQAIFGEPASRAVVVGEMQSEPSTTNLTWPDPMDAGDGGLSGVT